MYFHFLISFVDNIHHFCGRLNKIEIDLFHRHLSKTSPPRCTHSTQVGMSKYFSMILTVLKLECIHIEMSKYFSMMY